MEYTQWVGRKSFYLSPVGVLILVVMEYTQWVQRTGVTILQRCYVLILVVMEYTQWEVVLWLLMNKVMS